MIPTFRPRNSCIAIRWFVSGWWYHTNVPPVEAHVWRQLHLSAVARCSDSYRMFFPLVRIYTETLLSIWYFISAEKGLLRIYQGYVCTWYISFFGMYFELVDSWISGKNLEGILMVFRSDHGSTYHVGIRGCMWLTVRTWRRSDSGKVWVVDFRSFLITS